jgi:hypothetical protein
MRTTSARPNSRTLDTSVYLTRSIKGSEFDILDESEKKYIVYEEQTEYFKCSVCSTLHGSVDQYMWHARSKRHLKAVSWKEYEDLENDPSLGRMGDPQRGVPQEFECRGTTWFKCHPCDMKFYDLASVISHRNTRRHLSATTKPSQYLPKPTVPGPFRPIHQTPKPVVLELDRLIPGRSVLKLNEETRPTQQFRSSCGNGPSPMEMPCDPRPLATPSPKNNPHMIKPIEYSAKPDIFTASKINDLPTIGSASKYRFIPPPPSYDPRNPPKDLPKIF